MFGLVFVLFSFVVVVFNSSWPLLGEIMLDLIPGTDTDNIFEPLRTLKLDGIYKDISHVFSNSFS